MASGDPARAAEAHRALLRDDTIQFELEPFVPREPPAWLRWLDGLFSEMGPFFELMFWVVVALAVVGLLYLIARIAERGGFAFMRRRRKAEAGETDEGWAIAEAPARALLAEADALARDGRFAEAAHLLLFRSIEEIERRRPRVVRPALTSRDIAGAPQLPPGPRAAFGRIAMAVERSLFGGRALAEPDWRGCRAAYEEFALAREWAS